MEGIHIPAFPMLGDRISPTMMRDLVGAVRRNVPIAGKGIRLQRTMGGVVISALPIGKHIGGEAQARPLFPYRCEWVEGGSDKEIATSAYAFYLPSESLVVNGSEVAFEGASQTFGREGVCGGSAAFKAYADITLVDGAGVVCAVLEKDSSSGGATYTARITTKDKLPSGSEGESCSAVWFPVCEINEVTEGSGSETRIVRRIQQYAWGGEVVYGGAGGAAEDLGPFRLVMDSSGSETATQRITNCYHMVEQTLLFMSEAETDSAWAGNILWIEGDATGEGGIEFRFSHGSMSDYNARVADPSRDCAPIYKFKADKWPLEVECDLRNVPMCQDWGEYSY